MLGSVEMFRAMFPPFPTPDFVPDFTGYDLDQPGIDWYTMYDNMAQTPQELLIGVIDCKHFVSFSHTLRRGLFLGTINSSRVIMEVLSILTYLYSYSLYDKTTLTNQFVVSTRTSKMIFAVFRFMMIHIALTHSYKLEVFYINFRYIAGFLGRATPPLFHPNFRGVPFGL